MSTSLGKTERGVSGSAWIGGGGSPAADGMTLTAEAAASTKSVVPRSLARFLRLLPLIIVVLLSRWDSSPLHLDARKPPALATTVAAGQCAGGSLPRGGAGPLDAVLPMTDNSSAVEIEELRAARERLVRAADADRRAIERELHGGVHQCLVALATSLQLARLAAGSDPAAVETLLEEMTRDVRQALDETALLAQGIYPSALELGGLAALLRAAAVNAGVQATVDVSEGASHAPEIAMTVYLCWLALLARGTTAAVTIAVGGRRGTHL